MVVNEARKRAKMSVYCGSVQEESVADLLRKTQQIRQLTGRVQETIDAQTELLNDAHKELSRIHLDMDTMSAGIRKTRSYILDNPKRSLCTMFLVILALLYMILH